jgi:signal transduction histidine kinase/CheY-like chemotaxis protein
VTTQRPSISPIVKSRRSDSTGVAVRVPIARNGHVAYVLSAVVKQETFGALLQRQETPAGWVAGIYDDKGQTVARIPYRAPGARPVQAFLDAIARGSEGWTRMTSLEGIDNFTAHKTSDVTHWTVGVAMPTTVVLAGSNRAAAVLAAGILLTIAAALVITFFLGRRLARPIVELAAKAPLLTSGKAVDVPVTRIEEVTKLGEALKSASAAIRVRQELAEQQRQALEASDRAKDEFIAMLSHEMRNPLAALKSASYLLGATEHGNETVRAIQGVVERQTQHMTRLVEDLLDVSRIVMGKMTLEKELVDFADLVRGVLATWDQSGRFAHHRVTTRVEPAWVEGDRARLEQVVANLLHNAAKFTPAERSISVVVDTDGPNVRLMVADEGMGIPADALARVFEPFVQGPQGLDRQHGGLGVGLALVQRLVHLHDGRVAAQSEGPDRGSRFTVLLPAASPPALHKADAPAEVRAGVANRVLVVEDNDDARCSLSMLLQMQGYAVEATATGEAGIAAAGASMPDLVLLDIGLPDVDGYEVARRIRALAGGGNCIIVAVTGYGQPKDVDRALGGGFDSHVTKPMTLATLRHLLSSIGTRRSTKTAA